MDKLDPKKELDLKKELDPKKNEKGVKQRRLARECAKLDPKTEKEMAEEGQIPLSQSSLVSDCV